MLRGRKSSEAALLGIVRIKMLTADIIARGYLRGVSSSSCLVTSRGIEILYEVSETSALVNNALERRLAVYLPVISSGKIESRTSRSSICSSRPILPSCSK